MDALIAPVVTVCKKGMKNQRMMIQSRIARAPFLWSYEEFAISFVFVYFVPSKIFYNWQSFVLARFKTR